MPHEKRPFELKGVFVAYADVADGEVRFFRVLRDVRINVLTGTWPKVNKTRGDFGKGSRVDVKGVHIGGMSGKLETGRVYANVIFDHDGIVPGRRKRAAVAEAEE